MRKKSKKFFDPKNRKKNGFPTILSKKKIFFFWVPYHLPDDFWDGFPLIFLDFGVFHFRWFSRKSPRHLEMYAPIKNAGKIEKFFFCSKSLKNGLKMIFKQKKFFFSFWKKFFFHDFWDVFFFEKWTQKQGATFLCFFAFKNVAFCFWLSDCPFFFRGVDFWVVPGDPKT